MADKNSVKYRDEQIAKTAFGYALTDLFAPKKCIFQYKLSKDITRKRLYLETMDALLQGMDKIIIDQKNTVPYLPLTQLDKGK